MDLRRDQYFFIFVLIINLILGLFCTKAEIYVDQYQNERIYNGITWENTLSLTIPLNIPDLETQKVDKSLCPIYGINAKGAFCLKLNTIKVQRTKTWQECSSLCSDYVVFFFIKCKQWSYNTETKTCFLKNGDKLCKYPDGNYISGVSTSVEVGGCATTCEVGGWSAWSKCNSYCAGITHRVRHVTKSPKYKSEACQRLIEVAMCKGSPECPSNCPNYHVVGLGWGCKVEMNKGGGTMRKYVSTWHECLGLCNETEGCTYWSFQGTAGIEICLLVIGEVGCMYHALGWVSGDRNVVAIDCPVRCSVGEWSSWSPCPRSDQCTVNSITKRTRALISTPSHMNPRSCPHLMESSLCNCTMELVKKHARDEFRLNRVLSFTPGIIHNIDIKKGILSAIQSDSSETETTISDVDSKNNVIPIISREQWVSYITHTNLNQSGETLGIKN
ncbi:uncharacterized protein CMU_024030 [Cryptosporidium muris RN66]|uniref:Thrombospondin type 1 domain-containing protein n=1 Tax=Cryptosporidium muris (strain RN66) TaxID=441375 RepID=B6AC45_CRYMR|nr:uncharacterized protein CMU_024030 [Cryptosporidium muris RN66]EEA05398.1 hypothetical protein, conserved [Cryptosporidium muris RN66]|eukprot:XP_002139747.1 hypothetical protein [Cryptosporidium muris RN66]